MAAPAAGRLFAVVGPATPVLERFGLRRRPMRMTVTPEPQQAMDAAGRRRGRRVLPFVLVLAVAAPIGGVAASQPWREAGETTAEVVPEDAAWNPPRGTLVGYGHVAIEVPRTWGHNAVLPCGGVPRRDTVLVDIGGVRDCGVPRAKDVDSVGIGQGEPWRFAGVEVFEIDGLEAHRSGTTCRKDLFGGARACSATVYLPGEDIWFTAESSTEKAKVDEILGWIRTVPERVGVPAANPVNWARGGPDDYVALLEENGLVGEIRTRRMNGMRGGHILETSPRAGEMVEPGQPVTVTVTAEPQSPLDQVIVGINHQDGTGRYGDSLGDAEIRAGGILRVRLGDTIWAYGKGEWADTIAGEGVGRALTVDDGPGPNRGRTWRATSRGTSEITLTIDAYKRRHVLGVVTVVVR